MACGFLFWKIKMALGFWAVLASTMKTTSWSLQKNTRYTATGTKPQKQNPQIKWWEIILKMVDLWTHGFWCCSWLVFETLLVFVIIPKCDSFVHGWCHTQLCQRLREFVKTGFYYTRNHDAYNSVLHHSFMCSHSTVWVTINMEPCQIGSKRKPIHPG